MAYIVMGVPDGIRRDGWWLDDAAPAPVGTARHWSGRGPWRGLLALVLLADILFWDQAGPGLSLAIFLLAVALMAAPSWRPWPVLVLGLLPLVETLQPLSLGFGLAATLGFILADRLKGKPQDLALACLRFLPLAPVIALRDGFHGLRVAAHTSRNRSAPLRVLRALALPLGLGLVFASLLAEANPVLDGWARQVFAGQPDLTLLIERGLFWAGMALVIWPFLAVGVDASCLLPAPKPPAGTGAKAVPWHTMGLVTAQSVTTSLMLFNAMFAVQTGLDLAYLWSGAALPDGLSHAEYAHRGAYPLVATALLAGVFALVSRPFAGESRLVRWLLLAWVAQNVALVISALYRLDLYVESYGLTYLRAHAAVWMGLVAMGLLLVGAQVARGLANGWLVKWASGLGLVTLYICTFVNFAGLIADHNLTAAREGRLTFGLDTNYVCGLGPDAWAAVVEHHALTRLDPCANIEWYGVWPPHAVGWRDWSFRSWRVLQAGHWVAKESGLAYSGRG